MKIVFAILLPLFLYLQFNLWFGNNNMFQVWQIEKAIEQQNVENNQMRERNAVLAAEVQDLKQGLEAIEERARSELGMIKQKETFFQVIEDTRS
jgi:cell division protein FtsB